MRIRFIALAGLTILISGCLEGEPTFDTSGEEAYRKSLANVKQALSPDDAERLPNALMQLTLADTPQADGSVLGGLAKLASLSRSPELLLAQLGPLIDGKSGPQVLTLAGEKQLERFRRQMEAATEEIERLRAETSVANAQRVSEEEALNGFEISGARYYWREGGFRSEPVIDFKIENGSDHAIKRIFVRGVLETPGRSVPWVDDEFNYAFRGGLEPDEAQSLKLAPNSFGEWGSRELKDRNDLVLTLSLVNVEDANDKRLVTVDENDIKRKEKRIAALIEQRDELAEKIRGLGESPRSG